MKTTIIGMSRTLPILYPVSVIFIYMVDYTWPFGYI